MVHVRYGHTGRYVDSALRACSVQYIWIRYVRCTLHTYIRTYVNKYVRAYVNASTIDTKLQDMRAYVYTYIRT
jgi:hypothetical protein